MSGSLISFVEMDSLDHIGPIGPNRLYSMEYGARYVVFLMDPWGEISYSLWVRDDKQLTGQLCTNEEFLALLCWLVTGTNPYLTTKDKRYANTEQTQG